MPNETVAQSREIPSVSPDQVGMSAEGLAKVDAAMQDSVAKNRIPGGIVMIARKGKIVHARAYGQMDLAEKRPMELDSIVRIFSMTKSIASAAAMMLHEEGKLNVSDPVSKYLPELKKVKVVEGDKLVPVKREMTIADLMLHLSLIHI